MNKKNIAERLRVVMKNQNIKKYSPIAASLNVDESTISRWQTTGNISLSNAIKISEELDVSLDWLLLGRGTTLQHKHFSASENEINVIMNMRKIDEQCATQVDNLLTTLLKR
ncbi:helix-turn-helix domain-containing protein [Marinibactrum halimedae]|uniref:HTH cro/C1-type domain-containing protein n=1 Tax=Marinibactrum halimedae TaxID=1444977 RepID=A0AA37T3Q7_9GAMM|nr:helix-turn-helix domain-containing protein [Marinibactrum halimedae]MCD9460075.1 helix-turn-helix domain containing protein [Marinibactrum halimedae]GLS26474.1 hypothetical protein GCM10007877_21900 [Marinibactrum halimedae]